MPTRLLTKELISNHSLISVFLICVHVSTLKKTFYMPKTHKRSMLKNIIQKMKHLHPLYCRYGQSPVYVFAGVYSAGVCRREVTSRWLSSAHKQTHNSTLRASDIVHINVQNTNVFMYVFFQCAWDPNIFHQERRRETRQQHSYRWRVSGCKCILTQSDGYCGCYGLNYYVNTDASVCLLL